MVILGHFVAQLARVGDALSGGENRINDQLVDDASWLARLGKSSASQWTSFIASQAHEVSEPKHHHGGPHYKMIEEEDYVSWVVFFIVFFALIIFDNVVLHGKDEKLSFPTALAYTVFYMGCAGAFCVYVYFARGPNDAFNWGTGYLLEWMLSVDNLFVFRSIFMIFRTPDEQKHKPLFWGIIGAVFFRMLFFVIEEFLVHSFSWMHFLLGAFLIYTGVKIAFLEEEDDNPSTNPVFQKLIQYIPFVDAYAPTARFFARIPKYEEERIKEEERLRRLAEKAGSESEPETNTPKRRSPSKNSSQFSDVDSPMVKTDRTSPLRATRLLLVVVCLEVTDVVFAVDSVSAIVAQIPDLFLAYTACVFAMLGLRAMFFVVDELVNLFSLLSYGVAAILIFIGAKLILRNWIHVPPEIVCCILISTIVISMIASVVHDKMYPEEEWSDDDIPELARKDVARSAEGVKST